MNYLQLVDVPSRTAMNTGLSPARHETMLALLGRPGTLSRDCSPILNSHLRARMVTEQVAPHVKVTGLSPAIAALSKVMADIGAAHPDLLMLIGTAGMTCCRAVRGFASHFSNHSWGTAIDLTIGGKLSPLNATKIPLGLLLVYPHFHRHGFFWAAGYKGRTDPMHMEIADETLRYWHQGGLV